MADLSVNSIGDASGGAATTINGFTPTVSNMAGRNRLINGGMGIDQRNAGAAVTATGQTYFLDRFQTANSTATGTITIQQSSLGNSRSFKNTATAAVTDLTANKLVYGVLQRVESQNCFDLNSRTITVSFKVETNWSGNLPVSIQNSALTRSYVVDVAVVSGVNSVSATILLEAATVATNGVDRGLSVVIGTNNEADLRTASTGVWNADAYLLVSTSSTQWAKTTGNFINVTEVQLEEGSVATPFEHRMYGQELALCQRYFRKMLATVIYARFASGFCENTTRASTYIPFPTVMRSAPTFTTSGSFAVYSGNSVLTSVTVNASDFTPISCAINGDGSGFTVGQGALILANNDAAAFMALSAEL